MRCRLSALVIGNAKYVEAGTLKNPANDGEDIASKLEASGFTVTKKIDATHRETGFWALLFLQLVNGAAVSFAWSGV